jgi:hypothetical protein
VGEPKTDLRAEVERSTRAGQNPGEAGVTAAAAVSN